MQLMQLLFLIVAAVAQSSSAPDSKCAGFLPTVRIERPPPLVSFSDRSGNKVEPAMVTDALSKYGLSEQAIEALLNGALSAEKVREHHLAAVRADLLALGVPEQAIGPLEALYKKFQGEPDRYEGEARQMLSQAGFTGQLSRKQLRAFEEVDLYVTVEVEVTVKVSSSDKQDATGSFLGKGVATGLVTSYQETWHRAKKMAETVLELETTGVKALTARG